MASKRIGSTDGLSTTGVARGLLVENSKAHPNMVLVTITGVGGKRHASMLMDSDAVDSVAAMFNGLSSAMECER